MVKDLGEFRGTEEEKKIVYEFEHDMIRFKITMHTVFQYIEKILKTNIIIKTNEKIIQFAKMVQEEFIKSEQIKRTKSVLSALKYDELSYYYLYRRGMKNHHGTIYVVNDENVIKTCYRSEDSGWHSKYLKDLNISPRRKYKIQKRAVMGTRRRALYKDKDKKGQ